MNSASESILSAVDILMESAVGKLRFDKTVQGTVYSIVNLDIGEYKVKYSGNIFSAYAQDFSASYKVDDRVYVQVPEGDFNNKKLIIGRVSSSSLTATDYNDLSSQVVSTSPTFDNIYGYNPTNEYGVVAGAPYGDPYSQRTIYEADDDTPHNLFSQYALNNNIIYVEASFLTQFHNVHTKGNYGLDITFATASEGQDLTFRFDLGSDFFLGDPYSFSVYSPQRGYFEVPQGYLRGLKKIVLFEENFEYDRQVIGGQVSDEEITDTPNIFVSDIYISFGEQVDYTDYLYYLDVQAPQGRYFNEVNYQLNLVGRLIHDSEDIISSETCECKWYERDLSVRVGNDAYDKDAGAGWRRISTQDNQYIVDFNTLTIYRTKVAYKMDYKLVLIYQGETVLSKEVTLQNLLVDYDFHVIQETRGEDLILRLSDDNLMGEWYVLYPDGNYQPINDGMRSNEININQFLTYTMVTFYCGVYEAGSDALLDVLAHFITASDSEDDITISYVGEDTFRYDANGDIAIEDSEKERTLQVTLAWKEGVATQYIVEWLGPDGEDLTVNQRYNPSQSMMENVWIDSSNILHYNIKQKYKVNYSNNTFIVRITTLDGTTYSFQKEILFLKDGDQGTNGTTFVVAVRPCDSNGNKLSGFNPLMYYNGAWGAGLPLRCYVYKDGELINSNPNYIIEYNWELYNCYYVSEGTDRINVNGQDTIITNDMPPYVTAEVEITDSINDRTTTIYAYYPIDVAVNYTASEIDTIDISSIPSYIKYTSSGTNPQFYSNNIEFIVDGQSYAQTITSLNENILLLDKTDEDGLVYLEPASSFIFEDTQIPMLRCAAAADATSYVLHPIVLYLDTYGNENINGWDGQRLAIDEENGEYILAPQIGAGTKDSANRFTGIVMGQNSSPDSTDRNNIIGLYGYQSGQNTFGLLATGKAYFGTGNGQILIDGTQATISGGGGGNSSTGMTITLNNPTNSSTTRAINIANGNFYVTYGGHLNANDARIEGTIMAGSGSQIGGWIIGQNDFHSASTGNNYVSLNSASPTYSGSTIDLTQDSAYAIWAGRSTGNEARQNTFAVTKNGNIYARAGEIGGWTLSSNALTSTTASRSVGISTTTDAFWAGPGTNSGNSSFSTDAGRSAFKSAVQDGTGSTSGVVITSTGQLYARNAYLGGNIRADSGRFYGNVTIYPSSGSSYFSYTSYSYNYSSGSITSTTSTRSNIGLSSVVTQLLSSVSRAEALAQQATDIAREATSAASAAESAAMAAASASAQANRAITELASKIEPDTPIDGYGYISTRGSTGDAGYGYGIAIIYGSSECAATSNGATITTGSNSIWVDGSGCHSSSDMTGSDRRLKQNFNYNLGSRKYKELFFNLRPVEYELKSIQEARPGMKELGFVAQDVVEYLNKLDLKDSHIVDTPDDLEKQRYEIGYNSITTLNTYMLQEAYKKIDTLERQVAELKALIKGENGDI